MRIAVDQLRRKDGMTEGRKETAMEVMAAETDRLERLAREFADFGRLPEGPPSEVDLVELLEELGRTGVPEGVHVTVHTNGSGAGDRALLGHYEPLRRAFANLYRNAAEAMKGRGAIDVNVTGDRSGLAVTIADHGPGIPAELRQRVFEPYFTTKDDGTGLELALVRVTFEAHRGTISVGETPGGGATFAIVFPPPASPNLHQPPRSSS